MTYVPTPADYALALAAAILMAIEVYAFAGLAPAAKSRVPRSRRTAAYWYLFVYQWALVASVVALWIYRKRQWSALLLGSPKLLGFGVGMLLAGAYLAISVVQTRTIMKRPELWDRVRSKMAEIEPLSPHTSEERKIWTIVAITAGCCEEVLFRGFLLAFLASLAGLIAAVAITVLLFGLFHAYYGWKGILKTAAFGLFVTALALWSASLVPVIILHASIDLMTGDLAYRIISNSSLAASAPGRSRD
jgi:uncharacterized protein